MDNLLLVGLVVFIAVDVVLVAFIMWRRRGAGVSASQRADFRAAWERIKNESDARHAIIDADKLLDQALAARGFTGTLGEKMKTARKLFSDNNAVWTAHKLRNTLAHELGATASAAEKDRALLAFSRALRDLNAL